MHSLVAVVLLCFIASCVAKGPYTVQGNKVLDADGKPYRFLGVDRCSLEWSATGVNISLHDFQLIKSWGTNAVRVPMNQDFWLQGAAVYNANYKNTINQVVTWIQSLGMDVILDLHWSDKGQLSNPKPGQQRMADSNSVTFWTQVAGIYKNNPGVLFELYNEPHDVTWPVWLNGGDTGDGFNTPGMQGLYNAVRATGANNLVVIGGLNWAYDLTGVPSNRVKGNNIVYNTHPYDFSGKEPSDWPTDWGFLAATDPVIATEFGDANCSPTYYQDFVNYAGTLGASWTSWAWYPGGCGFPAIISDWSGTPNVPGQVIKTALQAGQ